MTTEQKKLIQLGAAFFAVIAFGIIVWKLDLLEPNVSHSTLIASSLNNSQSSAEQDTVSFDFGEISMAKGNVSTTFSLKNNGPDLMKITEVQSSCMCTTATIDGISFGMHSNSTATIAIEPDQTKEVLVTFDPNAHGQDAVGPITRQIDIRTNSKETPSLTLQITGNVVK